MVCTREHGRELMNFIEGECFFGDLGFENSNGDSVSTSSEDGRSVGEGRKATAACIGWSAPWWSAPWCLRRGVCAVVAACIGWSAYWMVTRTQGQCMNNAEGNEIKVT